MKHKVMWFAIGWAFAIVFPPSHITSLFKGKSSGM